VTSSTSSQVAKRRGTSPVEHTAVTIDDAFWAPRLQTVRERTLPFIYEQIKKAGYFEAYKDKWKQSKVRIPFVFYESDISKWLEAVSYSLATHPDPTLDALADEVIAFIASFQQPDGYLNIWFTQVEPERRWTNLRDWHELYCAGHLIEAAVAHFRATRKRNLLDVVCRYADYIASVFGAAEGQTRGYPGHEEIELALVKLFQATGEERYLRLSHYFIEERGQRRPEGHYFDIEARKRGEEPAQFWARTYEYNQSHTPVREQREVVGHAVRAMYLYSALVDLAKQLGDDTLFQVCERFWNHLCSTRIYVTGGIGSSANNEGFTSDYDLPNVNAYAETCAAIGLVFWNHRMLQYDADGRYADVLERALYNGILSSIALDGQAFFYENPLESDGTHHRQPWFRCACCPPNIARLFMSLGQYIYGVSATDVLVHLYIQSTATMLVGNERVVLRQESNYPWDGAIKLRLELEKPAEFGLNLRIPAWSRSAQLSVNGMDIAIEQTAYPGYAHIQRHWQSGDVVILTLDMPVERVYAHPEIRVDAGCVALQRGPLVYCLEAADNQVPLHLIRLPERTTFESHFDTTLLEGVIVIQGEAALLESGDWAGTLYRSTPAVHHPYPFTAIPYYAWDNRQPGEMRVWLRSGTS
jgi:uncharacterized protein